MRPTLALNSKGDSKTLGRMSNIRRCDPPLPPCSPLPPLFPMQPSPLFPPLVPTYDPPPLPPLVPYMHPLPPPPMFPPPPLVQVSAQVSEILW